MIIKRNQINGLNYSHLSVAIGNFDGIHLGHRYILRELKNLKGSIDHKTAVLSFHPHPVKILKPEKWKKNLVRFRTKIRLLEKIGIDILFLLPFTVNFSKFSGRYFIENILIKNIKVNNVLVGEDFKFGKNREGDISLLKEYADNNKFNLKFYTKKGYKGKDYSSSSIRNLINLGKLDEAYLSLGYFWEVEGKVIKGNAKGRELGFPTANLSYIYQISPSNGIYAGWVQVEGEKIWRQAAISTGRRPHYNGVKLVLEVHILFFSGNLYQKRLRVAFVQKIRGEQKFDSEEGLINQMKNDCQNIKNILKKKYITNDNTGHDAGP